MGLRFRSPASRGCGGGAAGCGAGAGAARVSAVATVGGRTPQIIGQEHPGEVFRFNAKQAFEGILLLLLLLPPSPPPPAAVVPSPPWPWPCPSPAQPPPPPPGISASWRSPSILPFSLLPKKTMFPAFQIPAAAAPPPPPPAFPSAPPPPPPPSPPATRASGPRERKGSNSTKERLVLSLGMRTLASSIAEYPPAVSLVVCVACAWCLGWWWCPSPSSSPSPSPSASLALYSARKA